VAGDSFVIVSASAVLLAVAAVASVRLVPLVTLAMVSLVGIPAPEICKPTSDAVTVPVVIVTFGLSLVVVPSFVVIVAALGAHFSRTRFAALPETCCMNATCVPSPESETEVTSAPVVPVL
jgi:uncharacterized membrane protein YvlD (DUF360 family)